MRLELGPFDGTDVQQWRKVMRRLIVELRSDPADLTGVATDDLLDGWSSLIDEWRIETTDFRWSTNVADDMAEYLLHGLDRGLRSPAVRGMLSSEQVRAHAPFTLHLVEAFGSGLEAQGRQCEHFLDEIRAVIPSS